MCEEPKETHSVQFLVFPKFWEIQTVLGIAFFTLGFPLHFQCKSYSQRNTLSRAITARTPLGPMVEYSVHTRGACLFALLFFREIF